MSRIDAATFGGDHQAVQFPVVAASDPAGHQHTRAPYRVGQRDEGSLVGGRPRDAVEPPDLAREDRKSTRLNSSHPSISYAVFCLKTKTTNERPAHYHARQ